MVRGWKTSYGGGAAMGVVYYVACYAIYSFARGMVRDARALVASFYSLYV